MGLKRVLVGIFVIVVAIWPNSSANADTNACGPFGDPPARVYGKIEPQCADGKRLGPWNDSDGTPRYACLYEPPQASASKPLPLVVFLHPSLANADSVREFTNLLDYLKTANLSDDPARPGFILLAPQGRNTSHYYPPPDHKGSGWDNWYRQLNPNGDVTIGGKSYPENVDAATIDHFVAAVAADGKIDRNRIYVSGWSNGGGMAYLYGLNRPGIAAVGVYSATDPLKLAPDQCAQLPVAGKASVNGQIQVFNPKLASYQVHNSCDIGGMCPNAEFFVRQLIQLGGEATSTIIDRNERATAECTAICGTDPNGSVWQPLAGIVGLAHHLRWPRPWTAAILDFFRRHPLKAPPHGI